ncbi:MAG TPA: RsmE family RNA methyltransferase, partial [Kofleriaceae bacterium]|nr:RsmE family RNA methyltransferase [Kofleriaceae bacterium]
APDGALKLILVTDPDAPLLKNALPAGGATAAWLLSGPEGDFSPDEITAARAAGFAPVSLGPLILRADTAPVTALAILNHLLAAPDK